MLNKDQIQQVADLITEDPDILNEGFPNIPWAGMIDHAAGMASVAAPTAAPVSDPMDLPNHSSKSDLVDLLTQIAASL